MTRTSWKREAIFIAVLAVGAFSFSPSSASMQSIQLLMMDCQSAPGDPGYSLCIGRVGSIADMMFMNGRHLPKEDANSYLASVSACADVLPKYSLTMEVFTNWAIHHPNSWEHDDIEGVIDAVRETWPCH
jgi:hypothetical protein